MNKYELVVIFKPSLTDETFPIEFDKVKDLIAKSGGTIEKIDNWGKRRLAYEIDKINEGIYEIVVFSAEPSAPAEMERSLRINESVLRYLITNQEA